MNFIIDVYKQVWDVMGHKPLRNEYLNTLTYRLDTSFKRFSEEIHKVLAIGLNDGYAVNLNTKEGITFVKIEIFDRDSYAFILDYLESNGSKIDYPIIPIEHSNAIIKISDYDNENFEELISELNEKFGKNIQISHSEGIFEKGATGGYIDLILWLGTNIATPLVINHLIEFFNSKDSYSSNKVILPKDFDRDVVLAIASKYSNVNIPHLKILDFTIYEDEELTTYFIHSRLYDIELTLNNSYKVMKCKLNQKTQTNI